MNPEFEWGRLLIAVVLLAVMFAVPLVFVVRDHLADRRRYGEAALAAPIRYTPDGRRYREGYPPSGENPRQRP
ncbi:hypothetical protein [Parafrankia discariae]|uniref:hypothetical protein n=1 Tax=Parafrankia discariae TaxID=365528 RepID=UPI000380A072|nr:hypothetical protein [Parafrankia discariae]